MIHRCRCAVLGIQPQRVGFGETMSRPVEATVRRVVRGFRMLADLSRQREVNSSSSPSTPPSAS